jgi:hypothetical protein
MLNYQNRMNSTIVFASKASKSKREQMVIES